MFFGAVCESVNQKIFNVWSNETTFPLVNEYTVQLNSFSKFLLSMNDEQYFFITGTETENHIVGDIHSPEELLKTITSSVDKPSQRISVSRDFLLTDSIRFFKKREFDFRSPVRVVFESEPAVDGGGPKREYFTLLLQTLISPSSPIRLFEGRDSFILPMHNMDAIQAGILKLREE